MTDKQPEALRLADRLEADAQGVNLGAEGMGWEPSANNMHEAAAELRRLHEVNAELVEALKDLAWYADLCVSFLKETHLGKSQSLNERVKKAAEAITKATGKQQ
jgi:hypothetical protein